MTDPFQLVTAEQPNCRWGVLSSSSSACVASSLHEWETPQEEKTVAAALCSSCGISWRSAHTAEYGAGTWLKKKNAFFSVTSSDTEPKVEFMENLIYWKLIYSQGIEDGSLRCWNPWFWIKSQDRIASWRVSLACEGGGVQGNFFFFFFSLLRFQWSEGDVWSPHQQSLFSQLVQHCLMREIFFFCWERKPYITFGTCAAVKD